MSGIASLDTNLVIRMLITREHPSQSEAIARAVESCQQVHIADLAISESVFVLTNYYHLERRAVAAFFATIFSDAAFHCNRMLFEKAFSYFVAHPALSFEDCCLAVYAELSGATPLLTFDRKLAHQLPQAELLKI